MEYARYITVGDPHRDFTPEDSPTNRTTKRGEKPPVRRYNSRVDGPGTRVADNDVDDDVDDDIDDDIDDDVSSHRWAPPFTGAVG
jgi:hypothetical protein